MDNNPPTVDGFNVPVYTTTFCLESLGAQGASGVLREPFQRMPGAVEPRYCVIWDPETDG